MSTNTPNYNYILPTPGSDTNTWSTSLNTNLSAQDTFLRSLENTFIGPDAPTTAQTGTQWIKQLAPATVWPWQVYDGTAWVTVGSIDSVNHIFIPVNPFTLNIQTITATGTSTYTPTAGMFKCIVEIVGGGGGGGSNNTSASSYGCGGGGAGYGKSLFTAAQIGTSQTVVIGAGGAGATGNSAGSNGGTSTFGTLPLSIITALGGSGGSNGNFNVPGGDPGTCTGGNILNSSGSQGFGGLNGVQGSGGASLLGLGGSVTNTNLGGAGINGSGYGSGGGASLGGALAGSGANGVCIITEYVVG